MAATDPRFQRRSRQYAQDRRDPGKYVKIFIGLAVLGAILAGVVWAVVHMGSKGAEYVQTVTDSREPARRVSILSNLRNIYKAIQTFAITEDRFPASEAELVSKTMINEEFMVSAGDPEKRLKYIPGQSSRSNPSNILVYDPYPDRDGLHVVLRVNGQIDTLTSEQLQAAVAATEAHLQ